MEESDGVGMGNLSTRLCVELLERHDMSDDDSQDLAQSIAR